MDDIANMTNEARPPPVQLPANVFGGFDNGFVLQIRHVDCARVLPLRTSGKPSLYLQASIAVLGGFTPECFGVVLNHRKGSR